MMDLTELTAFYNFLDMIVWPIAAVISACILRKIKIEVTHREKKE